MKPIMSPLSILFLLVSSIFANSVIATPAGLGLQRRNNVINDEAQICISTTCRLNNDNVACREACIRESVYLSKGESQVYICL
ncbi:hypothetical protein V8F06_013383, partial [Rhypophila decipiens]